MNDHEGREVTTGLGWGHFLACLGGAMGCFGVLGGLALMCRSIEQVKKPSEVGSMDAPSSIR